MTRRRRGIAARYSQFPRAYRTYWASVLMNLSEPLLAALPASHGGRALDLGCGTGVVAEVLARAGGHVIGVDASEGMLAHASPSIDRVAGDIEKLPLGDGTTDLIVSTFVLQHIPSPSKVFAEAARVLRTGGTLATATWTSNHDETGGPYDVMERALARAGAGPDPLGSPAWHERVGTPAKMRRYAHGVGLTTARAWIERCAYRWTPESFIGWASGMGFFSRRLQTLDAQRRGRALDEAARGLAELTAEDLTWRPEIVFLIARKA